MLFTTAKYIELWCVNYIEIKVPNVSWNSVETEYSSMTFATKLSKTCKNVEEIDSMTVL